MLHAGHTLAGDIVNEARGGADEGADAGFRGGGSDQNDAAKMTGRGKIVGGLFRRKIEEEKTVGPHAEGIGFEFFTAISKDRIVVGEKNQGDEALCLPKLGDELQDLGQSGAGCERTLAAELVDDAVGEGIGKRDTQFDDICARLNEGGDKACGGGKIGISGDEVSDEGFALLFFEAGKEVINPLGRAHLMEDSARDGRSFTRENRSRLR